MGTITEVGTRLKKLRNTDGYSTKEVAEFLEMTVEEYDSIENNEKLFDTTVLRDLCNLYMVDEEYIVYGTPAPDPYRIRLKRELFPK